MSWKKLFAFVLLALPVALPAQWAHYAGGLEVMHSLLDVPGGGWVLASAGSIIKLSPDGRLAWQRLFGGGPPPAYCRHAWLSADGGVVAQVDESFGGTATLFKLSSAGALVWEKTYTLANAKLSVFGPAPDGGTVMAGSLDSDLLVVKCSAAGEIEWQKSYGTDRADSAVAVTAASAGGFLVLGMTGEQGGAPPMSDLWVLKLSPSGDIEWQKLIGGDGDDEGESAIETADSGFLITGHSSSFETDGTSRFWLLKLSATGAVERDLRFDHPFGGVGWFSIKPADDGTFIVGLRSYSSESASSRGVILVVGQDGAVIRETAYPSVNPSLVSVAVLPTEDGGCLLSMSGATTYYDANSDAHVLKLSPSGSIEWQRLYGSFYSKDEISHLSRDTDGAYLLVGRTDSWAGLRDALWVMKTAPDGSIHPNCYFIRTASVSPQEGPGTWRNVTATVTDTSAVIGSPAMTAAPADIAFNFLGSPVSLPTLGLAESTLKIGVQADNGTTTPAPGSYVYTTGTSVTIRATPKTDYTFLEWFGNISLQQASATIVMDGNKEITATFYWSGDGDDGGTPANLCFIATAAYGDPGHPHVRILREMRDRFLLKSRAGRELVNLYYRYSPAVAGIIEKYPLLRAMSRMALEPIVALSSLLLRLSGGPL